MRLSERLLVKHLSFTFQVELLPMGYSYYSILRAYSWVGFILFNLDFFDIEILIIYRCDSITIQNDAFSVWKCIFCMKRITWKRIKNSNFRNWIFKLSEKLPITEHTSFRKIFLIFKCGNSFRILKSFLTVYSRATYLKFRNAQENLTEKGVFSAFQKIQFPSEFTGRVFFWTSSKFGNAP